MIETITGAPDPDYSHGVADLSPAAASIPARVILDRIEGYTGKWFGERTVTWLLQGPTLFRPPQPVIGAKALTARGGQVLTDSAGRILLAFSGSAIEVRRFDGTAWVSEAVPFFENIGYDLDRRCRWKITGIAGSSDPLPHVYAEAYRRMADYLSAGDAAADNWVPGVRSFTVADGAVSFTQQRAATWKADAFRLSGAADLLRYDRRAR